MIEYTNIAIKSIINKIGNRIPILNQFLGITNSGLEYG
jgi:hypothetical protein